MDSAVDSGEDAHAPAPPPRRRVRVSARSRRTAIVTAILAIGIVGYVTLLMRFDVFERPSEQSLGAAAGEAGIALYVQPITIDPVNDSMQIRINVLSNEGTPDRDLTLIVRHGSEAEKIPVTANQARPEATVAVDLNDGSIHNYPLDRYTSDIDLSCIDTGSNAAVPIRITNWEGILGYTVRARLMAPPQGNDIRIRFSIHRTGAIKFFAVAAYGAMVVMAISALTVATLVFVGFRKIEVTLMGAVGAIVFALPALRNALPGAPPLGVSADITIFFWAEFSAVIALGLFVAAWARHGPKP